MKVKNFFMVLIVFIVLISLLFIKKRFTPKMPISELWFNLIQESINKDNIVNCLIILGKKKIDLIKKDNKWVVESFYNAFGDEEKIEALIKKLDSLEGELRSEDKKLFSDYGITDKEGLHIILKNSKAESINIVIGTKKSGWSNNFVRLNNNNNVYITETNILSDLGFWNDVSEAGFREDFFVNKELFKFKQNQIKHIKLEKDNKSAVDLLLKDNGKEKKWVIVKNESQAIDDKKLNKFLGAVTNLTADSIVSLKEEGEFKKSTWKMFIELSDSSRIELVRGKKEDEKYYVKLLDKAYLFKVSEYNFNNIDKKDSDFFIEKVRKKEEAKALDVVKNNFDNQKKTIDNQK